MSQGEDQRLMSRRCFLGGSCSHLSLAALTTLIPDQLLASPKVAHFPATAKHVIFLHQSGAPSQIDLFDDKPGLRQRHGEELPESVRLEQRLTTMTAEQDTKPLIASPFRFGRHGQGGVVLSDLLPFTAKVADHLCVIRSMHTESINHDPALTLMHTGSQQPGRPSIGAWASYGLGSECENLPAYLVMVSGGSPGDQPLSGRLWSSGFLPSELQATKLRGTGDRVLYLSNPPGITPSIRRRMLDALRELNERRASITGDREIASRIAQFELAFEMQTSVPELVDLSDEPRHVVDAYGSDVHQPGSYASNCLMARRMVERGVRFVQLYHRGWDHHLNLESRIRGKCRETDQASAALVADLAKRGLLQDTLVVWTGEFGRTAYCQGKIDSKDYGRDHHPRCFSMWLAGGGVRGGMTYGATDEFSYNVVENPVHIHDLHATLLHCLGIDHERLTYRLQGRHHRLTDVAGNVVHDVLSSSAATRG